MPFFIAAVLLAAFIATFSIGAFGQATPEKIAIEALFFMGVGFISPLLSLNFRYLRNNWGTDLQDRLPGRPLRLPLADCYSDDRPHFRLLHVATPGSLSIGSPQ